jgi:DNA polymerase-3 subunit beta
VKIRVGRYDLASAVTAVAKALPNRPQMPVMAGVLVRAAGSDLTVSGFDGEVSNQCSTMAHVTDPGSVLVSGRLLAEITKALPAKPVDVAAVGSHVEITCGSARFTLPTMPVEDYPTLPEMPAVAGTVDAAAFASAVAQVAIAAGRDDTLPILTGVRMEFEGETLTMLATDRFRLAVREIPWRPDATDASFAALVPARTLTDVAKTAAGFDSDLTVAISRGAAGEGLIGFAGGSRRTTSRLLDGEFPPVRRLLPSSFAATADVSVSVLSEVVKRISLVAERSTPIRMSFSADGMIVEASGAGDAKASEAMDCTYHGEPMTIAFNHQYLIDGLASVGSAVARLSFNDPKKPATMVPVGDGASGYVYLMMPVRLG